MTGRSVPEWIGKTPDASIPPRIKRRIVERGEGRCTGPCHRKFDEKLKPQFDHRPALINCAPGESSHRESMIFAVCAECHSLRTRLDVQAKKVTARIIKKQYGFTSSRHVLPGCKRSRWKHKVGGGWERRP